MLSRSNFERLGFSPGVGFEFSLTSRRKLLKEAFLPPVGCSDGLLEKARSLWCASALRTLAVKFETRGHDPRYSRLLPATSWGERRRWWAGFELDTAAPGDRPGG